MYTQLNAVYALYAIRRIYPIYTGPAWYLSLRVSRLRSKQRRRKHPVLSQRRHKSTVQCLSRSCLAAKSKEYFPPQTELRKIPKRVKINPKRNLHVSSISIVMP